MVFHNVDVTSEIVAVPLAAGLLGLAAALLPAGERRRARQGAVLLACSLVLGTARLALSNETAVSRSLLFAATFCLLASMGRSTVLLVLDVVIERRTARPTPRIFRDLSTGLIYLIVALVALRAIDVEPGSILTTSALLTAVIGLAMQDTLGNMVSGLALQMQRPFDVGDWIEVEGDAALQQAGRVTEVTWRATTIMTLDHVEVILPNASLAKAAIRNYSRPSPVARRRVTVGVSYTAAPAEVHEVLIGAARDAPGVLVAPAPFARTRAFADSSIEYELFFFIDDFAQAPRIEGAVRDRIYYALARRRMEIPFPTRALVLTPPVDGAASSAAVGTRRTATLSNLDIVRPLPEGARRTLGERATVRLYGPGEAIVRKGEPSMELFVVERGSVAVEIPREGSEREGDVVQLAELGVGQCFGEMGLLTGEPRSATVRAKTLCEVVVVDHSAFHDVLASHPEVVDRMGALLASRQAQLEAATAARGSQAPEERSRRLISQIREFFKLV
ncbi:MAG TPA: mechanosensitive ion channel family protein [Polyangiaceae bacterium]|nr:mechanosensitive ion channel family protein [Polyangiaceae bacterium]